MIKCMLLVAAREAIVDQLSNSLSLIGVLMDVGSEGFPLFLARVVVVGVTKRDPKDPERAEFDVEIDLDGENLGTKRFTANYEHKTYNRLVVNIQNFVVPKPGDVRFRLIHNGKAIGEYVMPVCKEGGPKMQEADAARRRQRAAR